MQHNSFVDSLNTAQKARYFARMCELVDLATLGLTLHGRPLSVQELVNELASLDSPGVCVSAPSLTGLDRATRPSREYIMFGDIHGIAPKMPGLIGNFGLSQHINDLFKLPESLTLKAVSQGTRWRKKMKEWGYAVTFNPDGFGKVVVTLERHGRKLTLVQGNTTPYANAIGPESSLDLFMVQDLRNAGALIEKRS